MCMIYNEAWGNAKRGVLLTGEEVVCGENWENGFDVRGQGKIGFSDFLKICVAQKKTKISINRIGAEKIGKIKLGV